MNELKVKVVDVGHGLDGNGAGVTLVEVLALYLLFFETMIHPPRKSGGAKAQAVHTG